MKTILKYITLAILGAVIFVWANRAALPERPNGGIGGEMVFLSLPVMWWAFERTIRDLIADFKRMRCKINPDNPNAKESSHDSCG